MAPRAIHLCDCSICATRQHAATTQNRVDHKIVDSKKRMTKQNAHCVWRAIVWLETRDKTNYTVCVTGCLLATLYFVSTNKGAGGEAAAPLCGNTHDLAIGMGDDERT